MKKYKNFFVSLALVVSLLFSAVTFSGCNQQSMSRKWGGESKIQVPKGQKLLNVTWKEDSLWMHTRPMKETDVAETYTFTESSGLGIMEGKVILVETK